MFEETNAVYAIQSEEEWLAEEQRNDSHEVGQIYRLVQHKDIPLGTDLDLESCEFRQQWRVKDQLHISPSGVLEIWTELHGRSVRCTVGPQAMGAPLTWNIHRQAHDEITQTLGRMRLKWYWPGMTSEVRRLLLTCEVYQTAKKGKRSEIPGRR